MEPIKNEKDNFYFKNLISEFTINWNWLYLRSHLIFAILVFLGMLVFVWWLTT